MEGKCLHCFSELKDGLCAGLTPGVNDSCLLFGLDQSDPGDYLQIQSFRRQKIIKMAVHAADRILLQHGNGTTEETGYLIAMVAKHFFEILVSRDSGRLLASDFKREHENVNFSR